MKLSLILVSASISFVALLGGCSSSVGGDGTNTGGDGTSAPATGTPATSSGDPDSRPAGGTPSTTPPASDTSNGSGNAKPANACTWTTGSFSCGSRSCSKDSDFCDLGDATFGAACKSIGGDGSTCTRCATLLSFYRCGDGLTPDCSGDETTGITVRCK